MAKSGCAHPLAEIKAQMESVDAMNLTREAQSGIRALGMSNTEALEVIQNLTEAVFYKTMPSETRRDCVQDVYHPCFEGVTLYVKFGDGGPVGEYVTLSFKRKE